VDEFFAGTAPLKANPNDAALIYRVPAHALNGTLKRARSSIFKRDSNQLDPRGCFNPIILYPMPAESSPIQAQKLIAFIKRIG
jgi:hypothetical protein